MRRLLFLVSLSGVLLHGSYRYPYDAGERFGEYLFPGVIGPPGRTQVPEPTPPDWRNYAEDSDNALAVLLIDSATNWIGLVEGLKTRGIPFVITQDYQQALRHRTVLIYPNIPKNAPDLEPFVKGGGTLIAFRNVGGLKNLFGIREVLPPAPHHQLTLLGAREEQVTLAHPGNTEAPFKAFSYTLDTATPLARFEDGKPAIISQKCGRGTAIGIGFDLGYFFSKSYTLRQDVLPDKVINRFFPPVDLLLHLLQEIYLQGEEDAILIDTVPERRALSLIFSHDVHSSVEYDNTITYAEHEQAAGIHGTFFIQTKYMSDYNDTPAFTKETIPYLYTLMEMGMEVSSHAVSHSEQFTQFCLGTGDEQYPTYIPVILTPERTINGSVLGELRVSKFLLEHFVKELQVRSFRSGGLYFPPTLPSVLQATGYLYDSSIAANWVWTHLPFRLPYNRMYKTETPIFEFPVTLDDSGFFTVTIEEAIELADQISRYGGLYMVLIHPNETGIKLEFLDALVSQLKARSWIGTMEEFGQWWSARDALKLTLTRVGSSRKLSLDFPQKMRGLSLHVPKGWRLQAVAPLNPTMTLEEGRLFIGEAQGACTATFTVQEAL
jgi:peptidoglycan/xylan/chitin deacetylase (PgdA/CDA1 family)